MLPTQRVEGGTAFDRLMANTMSIGGVEVTAASLSIAGQLTVKNGSVSTMAAGKLVYISSYDATAGAYVVTLADADGVFPADLVLLEDILAGATGLASSEGIVTGINTNARTVGDLVYLSGSSGGWVAAAPTGDDQIVQVVGVVTVKSTSVGAIRFFPGRRIVDKVGTSGMQDDSVTSAKIVDSAVTSAKLAPGGVTKTKLAGGWSKITLAAGTDAGANVTVSGMVVGDELVSVISFTTAASIASMADRTSEYAVGAGVLTKATGTDERNNQLYIVWNDLT